MARMTTLNGGPLSFGPITMAHCIADSLCKTEDPGSNLCSAGYIVVRITLYGGPLSLGFIPSGRLKFFGDVDNWSSPSLCLQLGE